jgi:hypothetical protein
MSALRGRQSERGGNSMSVTITIGKRHLLGGLLLFALGGLVGGALIAPASSQAVTTYTRSASCAGLDFYPTDSRTEYDNFGSLRVMRSGDTPNVGSGVFRCDPGLPNGAVVKKVQFTALRPFGPLGMADCALRRSGLTTATATTNEDLGRVSFGGSNTTGVVRLTTSSITNATVDNASWGYWLECSFTAANGWTDTPISGLYGGDVIYTITAAKG